jgi:hypothetical protein
MIIEYPLKHRRYDQPEYEPFWAAVEALEMPLKPTYGHATAGQDPRGRRQDIVCGAEHVPLFTRRGLSAPGAMPAIVIAAFLNLLKA